MASLITKRNRIEHSRPHLEVASGNIASFNTDMVGKLKELKVHFYCQQEGSGTPSPTNIRPLSGWSGLDIWRTGRNVMHKVGYSAVNHSTPNDTRRISNNYGTTLNTIDPDESVTITQSAWPYADLPYSYRNGYFVIIDDNLQFGKAYNVSFRVTNITNNPLNASLLDISVQSPGGSNGTKTVDGDRIIVSNFEYRVYSNTPTRHGIEIRNCGMSFTISDIIVTEADESTTPYEEYQGTKNSVLFPETMAGGNHELISGTLTRDWWMYSFTGNENFAGSTWVVSTIPRVDGYAPIAAKPFEGLCSHYPYAPYRRGGIGVMYNESTCTFDGTIYDAAGWKQYCKDQYDNGTPVQVAYKLHDPLTYQLTEQPLKSLKGVNNIWSNSNGNVDVKYWTH